MILSTSERAGECVLLASVGESALTPEDFLLNIYCAVPRSGIVFLLCRSCYQYALRKHCEVKLLN